MFYLFSFRLLAKSIKDIVLEGDEDEFSDLMVTAWLEARLEWNRYNSQMQYQTFSQGIADPILMARGACLAEIVDCIEKNLNSQDLYWVLKIAVAPVESVSYRVKQTEKLIEKTSNYGKISQGIINTQLEMLERLNKSEENRKIVQNFKSQITRTMNTIEDTGFLEIADFADCVESSVIKGMSGSNMQFQVSFEKPNFPIGVPPEIVQAIDSVISRYIAHLVEHSMEGTPEQREGKSPFMNFHWKVNFDKDSFYFEFKDDGLGQATFNDFKLSNSDLDLSAELENQKSEGSSLKLTFAFFAVHEFVVFELDNKGESETFAFPASKVSKLLKESEIKTEKNYLEQIAEKDGTSVQRLKWPEEFSDGKDYRNVIIFKDKEENRFALDCRKFIGFVQSKMKRCSQQELCGNYLYGFIEQNGSLVKVLDPNAIAEDVYAATGSDSVLLRAS